MAPQCRHLRCVAGLARPSSLGDRRSSTDVMGGKPPHRSRRSGPALAPATECGGCRGFVGPVPLPLGMSDLELCSARSRCTHRNRDAEGDHPAISVTAVTVRIVYSDLDGTMVGPGGCFFRAEGSRVDLEPAHALADLLLADVPLVLVSGRTRAQLVEACGIFGADGYVAELGALIGWRGGTEAELLRGSMPDTLDSVPEKLVEALLARFAGRLEFHSPWHLGHEIDVMLRGQVDVLEVEDWLSQQGYAWLRLRDNGVLPRKGLLEGTANELRRSGL